MDPTQSPPPRFTTEAPPFAPENYNLVLAILLQLGPYISNIKWSRVASFLDLPASSPSQAAALASLKWYTLRDQLIATGDWPSPPSPPQSKTPTNRRERHARRRNEADAQEIGRFFRSEAREVDCDSPDENESTQQSDEDENGNLLGFVVSDTYESFPETTDKESTDGESVRSESSASVGYRQGVNRLRGRRMVIWEETESEDEDEGRSDDMASKVGGKKRRRIAKGVEEEDHEMKKCDGNRESHE